MAIDALICDALFEKINSTTKDSNKTQLITLCTEILANAGRADVFVIAAFERFVEHLGLSANTFDDQVWQDFFQHAEELKKLVEENPNNNRQLNYVGKQRKIAAIAIAWSVDVVRECGFADAATAFLEAIHKCAKAYKGGWKKAVGVINLLLVLRHRDACRHPAFKQSRLSRIRPLGEPVDYCGLKASDWHKLTEFAANTQKESADSTEIYGESVDLTKANALIALIESWINTRIWTNELGEKGTPRQVVLTTDRLGVLAVDRYLPYDGSLEPPSRIAMLLTPGPDRRPSTEDEIQPLTPAATSEIDTEEQRTTPTSPVTTPDSGPRATRWSLRCRHKEVAQAPAPGQDSPNDESSNDMDASLTKTVTVSRRGHHSSPALPAPSQSTSTSVSSSPCPTHRNTSDESQSGPSTPASSEGSPDFQLNSELEGEDESARSRLRHSERAAPSLEEDHCFLSDADETMGDLEEAAAPIFSSEDPSFFDPHDDLFLPDAAPTFIDLQMADHDLRHVQLSPFPGESSMRSRSPTPMTHILPNRISSSKKPRVDAVWNDTDESLPRQATLTQHLEAIQQAAESSEASTWEKVRSDWLPLDVTEAAVYASDECDLLPHQRNARNAGEADVIVSRTLATAQMSDLSKPTVVVQNFTDGEDRKLQDVIRTIKDVYASTSVTIRKVAATCSEICAFSDFAHALELEVPGVYTMNSLDLCEAYAPVWTVLQHQQILKAAVARGFQRAGREKRNFVEKLSFNLIGTAGAFSEPSVNILGVTWLRVINGRVLLVWGQKTLLLKPNDALRLAWPFPWAIYGLEPFMVRGGSFWDEQDILASLEPLTWAMENVASEKLPSEIPLLIDGLQSLVEEDPSRFAHGHLNVDHFLQEFRETVKKFNSSTCSFAGICEDDCGCSLVLSPVPCGSQRMCRKHGRV